MPEQATLGVFVRSCRVYRCMQDTLPQTCSSCAAPGPCLNTALPVCPLKEWYWMLNRSHACSPLYTYFIPIRQGDQKLFSFPFPLLTNPVLFYLNPLTAVRVKSSLSISHVWISAGCTMPKTLSADVILYKYTVLWITA